MPPSYLLYLCAVTPYHITPDKANKIISLFQVEWNFKIGMVGWKLYYRIQPYYRTCSYKRTVRQFSVLLSTSL